MAVYCLGEIWNSEKTEIIPGSAGKGEQVTTINDRGMYYGIRHSGKGATNVCNIKSESLYWLRMVRPELIK